MTRHPQVQILYEGNPCEVDEGIASLLSVLWSRGMETEFSCAGHPEGHPDCACNLCSFAYIAFPKLQDAVDFYHFTAGALFEEWYDGGIIRFDPSRMDMITKTLSLEE